ncbi:MAG TPA: GtrA family protein [Myxococcota bacterium]|jgi:dolichol-phosphate mannosyltransferase|nr:GtrA family protein [Myxococcota bacterium]
MSESDTERGPTGGRLAALWDRLPPERQRFLRFALVGASGVLVNFAFLTLGLWLFAALEPSGRDAAASALGIAVSILTNFLLNDVWTWGDRKKGPRKRDYAWRFSTYAIGAGIAAAIQFGVAALFRSAFGAHVYLAQAAGIAVGTIVNYVISNRVVFKDKA